MSDAEHGASEIDSELDDLPSDVSDIDEEVVEKPSMKVVRGFKFDASKLTEAPAKEFRPGNHCLAELGAHDNEDDEDDEDDEFVPDAKELKDIRYGKFDEMDDYSDGDEEEPENLGMTHAERAELRARNEAVKLREKRQVEAYATARALMKKSAVTRTPDGPIAVSVNDFTCSVTEGLMRAGLRVLAVIPRNSSIIVPAVNPKGGLCHDVRALPDFLAAPLQKETPFVMTYVVTVNTMSAAGDETELIEISAFIATAKKMKSKYVVLFCAKRILSAGNGATLRDIFEAMRCAGYVVSMQTYDLPRYGVASETTRVVVTGKLANGPAFTSPQCDGWLPPCKPTNWPAVKTVKEVLIDPGEMEAIAGKHYVPFDEKQTECVSRLGPGQSASDLGDEVCRQIFQKTEGKESLRHKLRRLSVDEPATSVLRDPCSKSRAVAHYRENRPISVPELQKLLTMNAVNLLDFVDMTMAYSMMIGVVPPHFVHVIIQHLINEDANPSFTLPQQEAEELELPPDPEVAAKTAAANALVATCSSTLNGDLASWREKMLRDGCAEQNVEVPKTVRKRAPAKPRMARPPRARKPRAPSARGKRKTPAAPAEGLAEAPAEGQVPVEGQVLAEEKAKVPVEGQPIDHLASAAMDLFLANLSENGHLEPLPIVNGAAAAPIKRRRTKKDQQ